MIKRRELLKAMALGVIGLGIAPGALAQDLEISQSAFTNDIDDSLRDYLYKMEHFNEPRTDDVQVDSVIFNVFKSTVMRLRRLQNLVGHGNFQRLGFDAGLRIARKYSKVGKFTSAELRFIEMIFYEDGSRYGFMGRKPLKKITALVRKNDVIKISNTGNYLYKGLPYETYVKIKKQLGDQVILTSGVRGVMKQLLLFLNKAYTNDGNLSLSSRSLAPPGYSFHGNGDFDVGQAGFGAANFTEEFTETEVFRRLTDLGYLKLRYTVDNLLGVRFEPWHIKIISNI